MQKTQFYPLKTTLILGWGALALVSLSGCPTVSDAILCQSDADCIEGDVCLSSRCVDLDETRDYPLNPSVQDLLPLAMDAAQGLSADAQLLHVFASGMEADATINLAAGFPTTSMNFFFIRPDETTFSVGWFAYMSAQGLTLPNIDLDAIDFSFTQPLSQIENFQDAEALVDVMSACVQWSGDSDDRISIRNGDESKGIILAYTKDKIATFSFAAGKADVFCDDRL